MTWRNRLNGRLAPCLGTGRLLAALVLGCAMAGCLGSSGGITPVRTAFNRGVYQLSKENFDQAISEFRTAVDENADDYRAWFNLGAAYQAKADLWVESGKSQQARALTDQAEEAYRSVIKLKPGNIRASINLAAIEYERDHKDQAKQRLAELIEAHPRHALPHAALAAHLIQEKQLEQAREHLLQATRLDPGNLEAQYLLGRTLWRLKDPDGARKAFGNALKRSSNDMATLLALGELEFEQQEFGQAQTYLTGALFIEPDILRAHHIMAQVSLQQGNIEKAVAHLWQARRLSRNDRQVQDYNSQLVQLYKRLIEAQDRSSQP